MKFGLFFTVTLFVFGLSRYAMASVVGGLEFHSCELSVRGSAVSRALECASLNVPLFDGAKDEIEIGVVRLKAKSKKRRPDPLLMLAGGPGQAASEAYLFADLQFHKLNWNRDIYLIDQRGTGRSTLFPCVRMSQQMFGEEATEPKPKHETNGIVERESKALAEQCLQEFDFDARYFTTSAALADFEAVRLALGIKQWNVYGVSYGTRVALHYLRQHPKAVRSVVLDSVLPPQHNLGVDIALQSQWALDRLIERCQLNVACNKAFPNLAEGAAALVLELQQSPVTVDYEDLRSGTRASIEFGIEHLAFVLRMSLYADETAALIPLLLHEAYSKRNFAPLARKSRAMAAKMQGMMALGMHNSVACTEDAPFYPKGDGWKNGLSKTYMGKNLTDELAAVCSVWPPGLMHEHFKEPVYSDKPVLLFSGSEDPITPPAYAELASEHLTNARRIVLEGQGHNASVIGCAPTLVAKFVNDLNPQGLNTQCLKNLDSAPFFIDFNGPTP